jgi:hypothetical protein
LLSDLAMSDADDPQRASTLFGPASPSVSSAGLRRAVEVNPSYYEYQLSAPWGGLSWETIPGDEEVAEEVIIFLEDRRLLFGERHNEDEMYCVRSDIRRFLTSQIPKAGAKELAASLKAMRAAARQFVEAAGPEADRFRGGYSSTNRFGMALGDLRSLMGMQIAMIAGQYGLELEYELQQILPPVDEMRTIRVSSLDSRSRSRSLASTAR